MYFAPISSGAVDNIRTNKTCSASLDKLSKTYLRSRCSFHKYISYSVQFCTCRLQNYNLQIIYSEYAILTSLQGRPQGGGGGGGGGNWGILPWGPSLKRAPGGPMKGPLNTCLKDRYTLIEQSDLNTLIEQSQYSSEEQCSKLIDKEIWLVMGSYCHCQQVVTFFFFFFYVFTLQLG